MKRLIVCLLAFAVLSARCPRRVRLRPRFHRWHLHERGAIDGL